MMQVTKVWWDGEKLMAEPIDPFSIYKEPEQPAQPQQEPVALIGSGFQLLWCRDDWAKGLKIGDTLYTSPPQRPWVGLTSKDVADLVVYPMNPTADLVRAIEAKLKEKNDR